MRGAIRARPPTNLTQTSRSDRNCHRGTPTRGADGSVRCDMNLFRTSKDIRPTFGSIVSNLLTVDKFNAAGLTGPG